MRRDSQIVVPMLCNTDCFLYYYIYIMSLEKYISSYHSNEGRFAVVDAANNELIKTFQTDLVAKAYSESLPGTKVVSLSRKMMVEILNNFNS